MIFVAFNGLYTPFGSPVIGGQKRDSLSELSLSSHCSKNFQFSILNSQFSIIQLSFPLPDNLLFPIHTINHG